MCRRTQSERCHLAMTTATLSLMILMILSHELLGSGPARTATPWAVVSGTPADGIRAENISSA